MFLFEIIRRVTIIVINVSFECVKSIYHVFYLFIYTCLNETLY